MTEKIKLFCPNCGKLMQTEVGEGERTDHKITCSSCGATSEVGHLKTAEGKTLLQDALDTAKDALKGPR
jgi:DNA-directed RNA polymerase subunit M/transcription elongation factor TFIIS